MLPTAPIPGPTILFLAATGISNSKKIREAAMTATSLFTHTESTNVMNPLTLYAQPYAFCITGGR